MLLPGEVVIHDGNYLQYITPPPGQGKGGVPRDWGRHPCGSISGIPKSTVQKIPRSDWPARIKELVDAKALLSDVRNNAYGSPIPSRDQNGKGYCWAHSSVSAAILARAKDNDPYVSLSAYAIACMIKDFQDEGGWNAESIQFLKDKGCPSDQFWPQQSMSRSNDNPNTWANALLHKALEWDDITEGDFDTQMTYAILGIPGPLDLNWWSHSICATDPIDGASTFRVLRMESGKLASFNEFDAVWKMDVSGGFGLRIWNSWGDSWSANGMGVLTESKATNNGAIALRSLKASTV